MAFSLLGSDVSISSVLWLERARWRERASRRVDRSNSSSPRRAVDAAQSRRCARRTRPERESTRRFAHRGWEQGHRECRQRLRPGNAPNGYRVDATATVARESQTRRTITMQQVMGAIV